MKILSFFVCVFCLLSFTVTSFGLELEEVGSSIPADAGVAEEIIEEELPSDVPEDEGSVPVQDEISVSDTEGDEVNPELGIDDGIITNISLLSVAPISPEDTSGLKAVLLEVLGDYDPVIVEYEYMNNNNYSSFLREVLPDYPWCASFLMLALFVYCIFRLGGALIG